MNHPEKVIAEPWIWGIHSVEACLDCAPECLLEIQSEAKVDPEIQKKLEVALRGAALRAKVVPRLPKFLDDKRTQGVAARLKKFPERRFEDFRDEMEFSTAHQLVMLDGVQDPRNYGALLRSAAAFGITAVFTGPRDQCPPSGVVAQASAGNFFRLQNVSCRNLGDALDVMREAGALACALDSDGEPLEKIIAENLRAPIVWVVGSEGKGLRSGLRKRCDRIARISMTADVESLNVSTAAAIAFYSAYRRG